MGGAGWMDESTGVDPPMSAGPAERSVFADQAPHVQGRVRRRPLAYAEVRVEPGEIAIGFESLPDVCEAHHDLYEQSVVAAGVDPENVLVVRITEAVIEVDTLYPDDPSWPVRTSHVSTAELH